MLKKHKLGAVHLGVSVFNRQNGSQNMSKLLQIVANIV